MTGGALVEVYAGDEAKDLAAAFCRRRHLPDSAITVLTRFLESKLSALPKRPSGSHRGAIGAADDRPAIDARFCASSWPKHDNFADYTLKPSAPDGKCRLNRKSQGIRRDPSIPVAHTRRTRVQTARASSRSPTKSGKRGALNRSVVPLHDHSPAECPPSQSPQGESQALAHSALLALGYCRSTSCQDNGAKLRYRQSSA